MTLVLSYSFLNTWGICRHQAYRRYIVRDLPREPETPEQAWGNAVHSAMEARIRDKTPLPENMPYEKFAKPLDRFEIKPEQKIGMTQTGDYWPVWHRAWLYGKLDVPIVNGTTAHLFDWKTGKRREEPFELEVQALLLQAKHPEVKTIAGNYVWFKEGALGDLYDLSDTQRTFASVQALSRQIDDAVRAQDFPKEPGPLCRWCVVRDCQYNKRAA